MLKTLSSLLSTFLFFAVVIIVIIISSLFEYSVTLPDYRQLEKYEPKVTTRLYAGDGRLLMEYARRLSLPKIKIFTGIPGWIIKGLPVRLWAILPACFPVAARPGLLRLRSRWQKTFCLPLR